MGEEINSKLVLARDLEQGMFAPSIGIVYLLVNSGDQIRVISEVGATKLYDKDEIVKIVN